MRLSSEHLPLAKLAGPGQRNRSVTEVAPSGKLELSAEHRRHDSRATTTEVGHVHQVHACTAQNCQQLTGCRCFHLNCLTACAALSLNRPSQQLLVSIGRRNLLFQAGKGNRHVTPAENLPICNQSQQASSRMALASRPYDALYGALGHVARFTMLAKPLTCTLHCCIAGDGSCIGSSHASTHTCSQSDSIYAGP